VAAKHLCQRKQRLMDYLNPAVLPRQDTEFSARPLNSGVAATSRTKCRITSWPHAHSPKHYPVSHKTHHTKTMDYQIISTDATKGSLLVCRKSRTSATRLLHASLARAIAKRAKPCNAGYWRDHFQRGTAALAAHKRQGWWKDVAPVRTQRRSTVSFQRFRSVVGPLWAGHAAGGLCGTWRRYALTPPIVHLLQQPP